MIVQLRETTRNNFKKQQKLYLHHGTIVFNRFPFIAITMSHKEQRTSSMMIILLLCKHAIAANVVSLSIVHGWLKEHACIFLCCCSLLFCCSCWLFSDFDPPCYKTEEMQDANNKPFATSSNLQKYLRVIAIVHHCQ